MSTRQAEAEARQYLGKTKTSTQPRASKDEYDRALRKATASFDRLHQAVRLAQQNAQSKS